MRKWRIANSYSFFLVCGLFESNNLAQTRWAYFTLALGSTDSRNYYFLEFLQSSSACKKMSYLLVRMQSYITFSLVFADWCVRWGWGSVRLYRGKRGPRRTTGVSSKRSLRWIYKRKSWHTVTRRRRRLLSVMLSLGFILSSSSLSLPDYHMYAFQRNIHKAKCCLCCIP